MNNTLDISMAAGTDRGQVRARNEDSVLILPSKCLAILADGMGGHQAGDVASRMAVDAVAESLTTLTNISDPLAGTEAHSGLAITSADIMHAIQRANDAILNESEDDPQKHGMGSTIVVTCIEQDRFTAVHLGDSRMYRIRGGEIERITKDHTLAEHYVELGVMSAEDAKTWEGRNMLLKGLGIEGDIEPEANEGELKSGDTLIMCSDGLTDVCDDATIRDLTLSSEGPQHAVTRLIQAANDGGGPDNITTVVINAK